MIRLTPRKLTCWAACSLFLLGCAVLPAASPDAVLPYVWRDVAIHGGGYVTGLVYHPAQPDLLYARTDVGGVFRWNARAERWTALNDALGQDEAEWLGVLSLAVDPQDPNQLYLACGSYTQPWAKPAALLRSSDQGRSWTATPLPFRLGANEDGRSMGERLQVDPRQGGVLWLGTTRDGLWRSADHGRTWARVARFPATAVALVCLAPQATGDLTRTVYVATADAAAPVLYRTEDAGETWAPVPGQPAKFVVHHAAFAADGALYLAAGNGIGPNDVTDGAVWKYVPADARWTDVTPLRPDAGRGDRFGYAGLAVDPGAAGTVLVSTLDRWKYRDEVFRTTDGGGTWRPLVAGAQWDDRATPYIHALKPHWFGAVALDPADRARAWIVTGYGVWATRGLEAAERGEAPTWRFENEGLEETVIDELISPPAGAPLLSAMPDLGGFRHDDLSRSPAAGMFQPFQRGNPSLAMAAQRPEIFVRTLEGEARGAISTDGGTTWTPFKAHPPLPARVGAIAISVDAATLLWLPTGSAPYRSTDRGATWQAAQGPVQASTDFFIDRPVADAVNPQRFYIYGRKSGRVFGSTDAGASFRQLARVPQEGGPLRVEPGREGHLWLPTRRGLLVSTDAGRSFQPCAGVERASQVGFGRAAPGRARAAVFLLGQVSGVTAYFRSDDSGATWLRISDAQHQFGWVRTLTGDPRVFGRVYVGTSGRGIVYGDPAAK
ncbi:carbohydrate-binding protein [Opitutus sp. ER46]|uniref:carbohydrate-binding protein n=1 Tax=Opitutus sp. ER46 TaxID=2161864 RepID=UPI000D301C7B|nr:carbohydrate-binding protein [Opitutus sp. ER46]PTX90936.1 carbohydrate-binding protein [Opitutus sp. ER46]